MAEPTVFVPLGKEGTGAATILQSTPFLQQQQQNRFRQQQALYQQEAARAAAAAKAAEAEKQRQNDLATGWKFVSGESPVFSDITNAMSTKANDKTLGMIKEAQLLSDPNARANIGRYIQGEQDKVSSFSKYVEKQTTDLDKTQKELESVGIVTKNEDIGAFINEKRNKALQLLDKPDSNMFELGENWASEFAERQRKNPDRIDYIKMGESTLKGTKMVTTELKDENGRTYMEQIPAIAQVDKDGQVRYRQEDLSRLINSVPIVRDAFWAGVGQLTNNGVAEDVAQKTIFGRFFPNSNIEYTKKTDLESTPQKQSTEQFFKDNDVQTIEAYAKQEVKGTDGVYRTVDLNLGRSIEVSARNKDYDIPAGTIIYTLQNIAGSSNNPNYTYDAALNTVKVKQLSAKSFTFPEKKVPYATKEITITDPETGRLYKYKKNQPMRIALNYSIEQLRKLDLPKNSYELREVAYVQPKGLQYRAQSGTAKDIRQKRAMGIDETGTMATPTVGQEDAIGFIDLKTSNYLRALKAEAKGNEPAPQIDRFKSFKK